MSFWRYLWHDGSTRCQLMLTFAFMVGFVLLALRIISLPAAVSATWQNWIDLLLATSAITVAVFICYNVKSQDWKHRLPKRLDVSFFHGGSVFYHVVNAPLVGENDVRAWGQQLGNQMNDGHLQFREFDLKPTRGDLDSIGRPVTRYDLTIWLQKVGDGKAAKTWRYDDDGRVIEESSETTHPQAAF